MFKKNISDGIGSRNESIHTPLDPPLFWLDNIFKGTVRSDWICMRVVPLYRPWRISTAIGFFIFYFWSWIFEKTSKFWGASCKNESNLLLVQITVLHRILSSYWLAHFYLMKKSAKVLLYFQYFGLDSGNSLPKSRKPKNNWCLSHIIGAPFGGKNAVWSHANGDLDKQEVGFIFAWAALNFELLWNIQDQK